MAGVQYFGFDSVVNAYVQREYGSFAIFQGKKEMVFAYVCDSTDEGKEKLSGFLNGLWKGTTAVYCLKVYSDKIEEISPTTPDNGCFNFRLNSEVYAGGSNNQGSENLILSKLAAMEARFAEIDSEENDEPESDPDQWDKIGAMLEKPIVVAAINKLFGIDLSQPAKVGNVPPSENEDLINKAIGILRVKDPQLGSHLMKLATIAQTKPANFQFLLNTLDSM
jgi:hypothetical protein